MAATFRVVAVLVGRVRTSRRRTAAADGRLCASKPAASYESRLTPTDPRDALPHAQTTIALYTEQDAKSDQQATVDC